MSDKIKMKYEMNVFVKRKDTDLIHELLRNYLLIVSVLLSIMTGLGTLFFCVFYHVSILYSIICGILFALLNILMNILALNYYNLEEKKIYTDIPEIL